MQLAYSLHIAVKPPAGAIHRLLAAGMMLLHCLLGVQHLHAEELAAVNTPEVAVFAGQPLMGAAREIAGLYPQVRDELEETLGLQADFRPSVVLVSDRQVFEQVTGNPLIVAYAMPEKMLAVIDYPRASKDPFTARTILKHELCHLMLHRHISSMPRWLDEGVCQWASGGFAELFSEKRESALQWASISGRLLRLSAMDARFPQDEHGLVLAYEQSRSIMDFIAARYGRNGITNILTALENGKPMEDAVSMSLGTTLPEIEKDWQRSLRTWTSFVQFMIANMYSVIFLLGALGTMAGYARYRIRKKRLMDEEEAPPPDIEQNHERSDW